MKPHTDPIKRVTIRLPLAGWRAVKLLSALTGETQPDVISRLVQAELERVLAENPTLWREPPPD